MNICKRHACLKVNACSIINKEESVKACSAHCKRRKEFITLTTEELKAELETRLMRRDAVPAEDYPSTAEKISPPDFLPDNE